MWAGPRRFGFVFFFFFMIVAAAAQQAHGAPASWRGTMRASEGHPVANALLEIHATSGGQVYSTQTSATGDFTFGEIAQGTYSLRVTVAGKIWNAASAIAFKDDVPASGVLELSATDAVVRVISSGEGKRTQGSGGENLSSGEVSRSEE